MNLGKARELREGVRRAYSAAAKRPHDEHPFPVGRSLAESLGYPEDLLAGLPSACVDAFSGVSNVAVFADIPKAVPSSKSSGRPGFAKPRSSARRVMRGRKTRECSLLRCALKDKDCYIMTRKAG